jgi:hypothetical protein
VCGYIWEKEAEKGRGREESKGEGWSEDIWKELIANVQSRFHVLFAAFLKMIIITMCRQPHHI